MKVYNNYFSLYGVSPRCYAVIFTSGIKQKFKKLFGLRLSSCPIPIPLAEISTSIALVSAIIYPKRIDEINSVDCQPLPNQT